MIATASIYQNILWFVFDLIYCMWLSGSSENLAVFRSSTFYFGNDQILIDLS